MAVMSSSEKTKVEDLVMSFFKDPVTSPTMNLVILITAKDDIWGSCIKEHPDAEKKPLVPEEELAKWS